MCGLLASTGKIETRYITALGCLSEKRGDDSAGVAWTVGENVRVAKVAQTPLVAFPVSLAPAIRHAAKYASCLIGHTRQATTGAVNQKNAHPFYDAETNIAWAHNGVISNYSSFGEFNVDSECLIHGIVKRDFSAFWGPIALVWIEAGKLHAFRKGNPLYRGFRNGAVYLASEDDMLTAIGCKRIKELSEGFEYWWDGPKLEGTKTVPYNKLKVHKWTAQESYEGEGWPENYGRGGYTPRTLTPVKKIHRCHTEACKYERTSEGGLVQGDFELCFRCQVKPPSRPMDICSDCYLQYGYYGTMGD